MLVTRPEPGGSRTAARLRALGHEPLSLPLTRIVPLQAPDIEGCFGMVAISSANALRHATTETVVRLGSLPCCVVGERTGAAARACGFEVVLVADGAEELAHRIAETTKTGTRVAYLCGRVRRHAFETICAAAGIKVRPIEIYDSVKVSYSTDRILSTIGDKPPDAVLCYSVLAVEAVLSLCKRPELRFLCEKSTFYCLSERIADAMEPMLHGRVNVAGHPNEEALLQMLSGKN